MDKIDDGGAMQEMVTYLLELPRNELYALCRRYNIQYVGRGVDDVIEDIILSIIKDEEVR